MKVRRKKTLQALYFVDQYKKAHGVDEWDTAAVAHWAFENGLWQRPPLDPELILRREIAQALRAETITDKQGREVRKNHPVIIQSGDKRMVVWAEITKAKPQHMLLSKSQRRNGILADCRQMALDFDSWNDNNIHGVKLPPVDFNFNPDIDESRYPTHYPDEPQAN